MTQPEVDDYYDFGDEGGEQGAGWPVDDRTGEELPADVVAELIERTAEEASQAEGPTTNIGDLADLAGRLLAEVVRLREQLEAKPPQYGAVLNIRVWRPSDKVIYSRDVALVSAGTSYEIPLAEVIRVAYPSFPLPEAVALTARLR